ncbi:HD-GYP domain-containing protein [Arcobacter sp. FWKO B]|uniref:HD-GYP domain-containing protein n=1 Tax=Arcobacter sp. FWKO B TaxID=2593672 RepID=UPI0018A5622A|nr:HD domain-containing phosphohydrolase [Arcobacter sp. FWKO B]QOG11200.1 HD domain-containing protein [Arcobacter sp. FWKO B]
MPYIRTKLHRISLKVLPVGTSYDYAIFYNIGNRVFRKLLDKSEIYSKEIQQKVINENIIEFYVLHEDFDKYETDMRYCLKEMLDDNNISIDTKAEVLHDMAGGIIHDILDGELNIHKIKQVDEVVNSTVNILMNDPTAIKAMLKVTSYDYYTFTHCVNVSTYAMGFGTYLKLSLDDLKLLGMSGMLHDVGKRKVPSEIINKNGKLTYEEFELVKKHPVYGVEILKNLGESNKLLLKIIYQHHEKLNGSGYPLGIEGNDIHMFSRIMAISDIFDALTTRRSYKEALKTFEAFNIMYNHMKDELDRKLVREFMIFMRK